MRRIRGAGGICVTCVVGMLVVAAPAGAATATERITDGGFDQTLCSPLCVSPVWAQGGQTNGSSGVVIGPICHSGDGNCDLDSGYSHPPNWARLGRASEVGNTPAAVDSWIQQSIQLPASFPPSPLATLHFVMRIRPGMGSSDAILTVYLDGTPILSVGSNDGRFSGSYEQVDVPLDAYVGPGLKTLRFEAGGQYQTISNSFDIDDVSVTAPAALAPPALVAGPTGQRAAALAKCKKKFRRKRKKCKKHANLLPVRVHRITAG